MNMSTEQVIDRIDPAPGDRARNIVMIETPIEVYRPYDYKRGDARRFTQGEAFALAQLRVKDRGCRQQVRRVRIQPGDEALVPVWLIQDI